MRKEILLLAYVAILTYLAEALYAPIYAIYVEKIGGGVDEAGYSWGIYMVFLGIFGLVVGRFIDRLKRHTWILYVGMGIAALLSLGYIFVRNVLQLYVLQALMGIVWAFVNPVWDAYYSLFMEKKEAATSWSLFEGGSRLANGVGAIVGGFIAATLGFKVLFVLAALLNLLAALVIFFNRRLFETVY